MSDTRNANMEKRRQRIVAEAHTLLAEGGFDRLNLRDLAAAADVTVPTIYNLIGNKEELLKALVVDTFSSYESRLRAKLPCPTAELPALTIATVVELIAEDPHYYRASHLAIEHLRTAGTEGDVQDLKRPTLTRLGREIWQRALDENLLRGQINGDMLIDLMITHQQAAMSDWAHQLISLEEMHRRSLQGFYTALAADASPAFHATLSEWLQAL